MTLALLLIYDDAGELDGKMFGWLDGTCWTICNLDGWTAAMIDDGDNGDNGEQNGHNNNDDEGND